MGELALATQELDRLGAIARDVEVVLDLALAQRFLGEPDVARVVLDQQDLDLLAMHHELLGTVNDTVEPRPGVDSTQIFPPWRSTIFLQIARPMPVPGYVSRACRR